MSELDLDDDRFCFVCGDRNPDGLKIRFVYPEEGRCRAEFTPAAKFQGWRGILHGGITSTLLDEAFAHAAGGPEGRRSGTRAVTAEMTVRFKRPVRTGERLFLEGRIAGEKGRLIEAEAELKDASGTVLASATGKLIKGRRLASSS